MKSIPNLEITQASSSEDGRYALLWSQTQCALHVEPLQEMLNKNRRACASNRCTDYIPVFVGTRELCSEAAERLRPVLCERRSGAAATH